MKHFYCIILLLFCLTACAPAEITTRRMENSDIFSDSSVQSTENAMEQAEIEIISVTESVPRGETATVSIQGESGTLYAIAVHYASGVSKAKGLEPAEADANGCVTWSWKIGYQTAPGEYKITVTGGGKSADTYFSVE